MNYMLAIGSPRSATFGRRLSVTRLGNTEQKESHLAIVDTGTEQTQYVVLAVMTKLSLCRLMQQKLPG